jgi:hypothetical protein
MSSVSHFAAIVINSLTSLNPVITCNKKLEITNLEVSNDFILKKGYSFLDNTIPANTFINGITIGKSKDSSFKIQYSPEQTKISNENAIIILDKSGKIGIGSNSFQPEYKLDIDGSVNIHSSLYIGNKLFYQELDSTITRFNQLNYKEKGLFNQLQNGDLHLITKNGINIVLNDNLVSENSESIDSHISNFTIQKRISPKILTTLFNFSEKGDLSISGNLNCKNVNYTGIERNKYFELFKYLNRMLISEINIANNFVFNSGFFKGYFELNTFNTGYYKITSPYPEIIFYINKKDGSSTQFNSIYLSKFEKDDVLIIYGMQEYQYFIIEEL